MIYNFTVRCDNSNPVPYKRTTQKQKFVDKGYKKYVVWKNKVVGDFIKEFKKYPHNLLEEKLSYNLKFKKINSAKDLQIKGSKDYLRHIENEFSKTIEKIKVQDSEMRRLNIIIDNYEVKLNITTKED